MAAHPTSSYSLIFDRVLWSIVGLLAGLVLLIALSEAARGWDVNWIGLIVGSILTILTVVGFVRRWGPLVPCMFLGVAIFSLSQSPLASSHEEAVYKDLGVPLIGAIFGAFAGYFLERVRSGNERSRPTETGQETR